MTKLTAEVHWSGASDTILGRVMFWDGEASDCTNDSAELSE